MRTIDQIGRDHAGVVLGLTSSIDPPHLEARGHHKRRQFPGWVYATSAAFAVLVLAVPVVMVTTGGIQDSAPFEPLPPTSSSTTEAVPSPTTTVDNAPEGTWTVLLDIDFPSRSGATYVASDDMLFVWGGLILGGAATPDGGLANVGYVVDLNTLRARPVAAAPIPPRISSAAVWTGTEFIVFGGSSGAGPMADGAAYNPATDSWRTIPTLPLPAGLIPTAAWNGTAMIIWMTNDPAVPDSVAAYDPNTDSWQELPPPPIDVSDAVLLWNGARLTLVGGPPMRPGIQSTDSQRLRAAVLDTENGSWSEPIISRSPFTTFARATSGPGDLITVLTSPTVYLIDGDVWDTLGPAHHCPEELDATSGGGIVYIRGHTSLDFADGQTACVTEIFNGSLDDARNVIAATAFDASGDKDSLAFLATQDGRLVTVNSAIDSNQSIVAVYTPG